MAEPIYKGSKFYTQGTFWLHATRSAQYARRFARRMGANPFVAYLGALLHDVGAALYGKKDHHITGAKEATMVLLECGCPPKFIGLVASCIHSHRGSRRMAFAIPEAICVAAADAMDHFTTVDELWVVQREDLGVPEKRIPRTLREKLTRDWEKTDPRIQQMLNGTFERAIKDIEVFAAKNGNHKEKNK